MMIFVKTFYECDKTTNKLIEKTISQILKIFTAFWCWKDLIINKMGNQSLFIDTNLTAASRSALGSVNNLATENKIGEAKGTRGKYIKYANEDRFKITKFASETGAAACVKIFKTDFPKLNENTIRDFKRKYEQELKTSRSNGQEIDRVLTVEKRRRPLLLGRLYEVVQKYINAASCRGALITRSTAVSNAKALMRRHPHLEGKIDLYKSEWAKSLFQRIGFTRRKATSSNMMIPAGAKKRLSYYSIPQ